MKARIYWILLTTSLVPTSVFSQTINMNSSQSFNGENGGTFTPKDTSNPTGTVYIFNEDVNICNAGKTTPLTTSCFDEKLGSLYFIGNGHELVFKNIDTAANAKAGAINASSTLTGTPSGNVSNLLELMNFSSLSFINASGGDTANPTDTSAIKSIGMAAFMNNTNITVASCASSTDGGAIKSRGCMLSDSSGNVLFDTNSAATNGGAISVVAITTGTGQGLSRAPIAVGIERNQGAVTFSNNQAGTAGGAVYSAADVSISDNKQILFSNNKTTAATGKGGALCSAASKKIIIEKNKAVVFDSNVAVASGGAIDAGQDFVLSSGGEVKFTNNEVTNSATTGANTTATGGAINVAGACTLSAAAGNILFEGNKASAAAAAANSAKGGAIYIKSAGSSTTTTVTQCCTLSADAGNIVFDGNKVKAGAAEKRNSIMLSHTATAAAGPLQADLRAKHGSGIFFYDPINTEVAQAANSSINVEINKPDPLLGQFTGDIVFSGETLTEQERAVADNSKSTFAGKVTLAAGTLRIKSSAYVSAKTFTQTAGSTVEMGAGTTLESTDNATALTLEELAIDVASLAKESTVTPAKIKSGQNVTLKDINLVANGDTDYEYTLFGKDRSLDVIDVEGAAGSTVTLPGDISVQPAQHYGYQGSWKIPKVTLTANATQATLAAQWTYSGYIPHPERRGGLVPNTLWGAFSDMRVIQKVMKSSASHELSRQGIWGAGLGSFLRTSSSGMSRQYSHSAGGYLIGLTGKPMFEDIFSLGFYQMFGKDKDYSVMKNHSTVLGGSIYYQHGIATELSEKFAKMFSSHDPVVVHVQFSYNHAKHDEKTTVTSNVAPNLPAPITMNGSWGNDCIGVEVGSFVTVDLRDSYFLKWFDQCHPFIKCQYVYAHQEDFEEDNVINGRTFDSAILSNLSIPMGVIFEKKANHDGGYVLSITYSPDAYRENPKTKMFLLADPTAAKWETKGTNLARQSLAVTLGQHFVADSHLEFFANGGFEIRGSSRAYNVDIRGQFKF